MRVSAINAISGGVQITVNFALLALTVPIFIGKLGLATYGVYALVVSIGNIGVFTNLGFNTSLIKYLAEQRDRSESNYDIVVVLIVVGGASALVALLGILFSDAVLLRVLGLSSGIVDGSVRTLYATCIAANVCQILGQIASGVLDSQLKVFVSNAVQLGVGIASKALIIVSLLHSPSLGTIGWITLATSFVGMSLLGWFAYKTWGRPSVPHLKSAFIPVFLKHYRYGRSIYGSVLVGFLYEPFARVLIGRYVGLVEVGYFDIALRVKLFVWSIIERVLYPFAPLLATKSNPVDVRELVEDVQTKLAIILVPVFVGTIFLGKPLVSLWIGDKSQAIVLSAVLIVTSYLVSLFFVPLYYFLMYKGYPEKTLVIQSSNAVSNIVLFMVLVPHFHYYGALAAFCAALYISNGLCAWYQWSLMASKPLISLVNRNALLWLGVVLLFLSSAIVSVVHKEWVQAFVLTVTISATSLIMFRHFRIISMDDIDRYVGRSSWVGSLIERILIRKA